MIKFDFSGATRGHINEKGISPEDIDALYPALASAHNTLTEKRSSGDIMFYDLPSDKDMIADTARMASELKGRFRNIVHLGIGGSSLGPKTIFTALKGPFHNIFDQPRFFFLDNIDPEQIHDLFDHIEISETLFIVASKSGATAETASQFLIVMDMLKKVLGGAFRDHLLFITDPVNGILRKIAKEERIRSLPIPPKVGGRFSVLTPVGLFPASLMGIDIERLSSGALEMSRLVTTSDPLKNPAYLYGAIHFLAYARGVNISVLMPYSNALYDLADWYRQLWAESLGKMNSLKGKAVYTGQTPVKALGATDQHSQVQLYAQGPFDKIINVITVDNYRNNIRIPGIYPDIDEFSYLGDKDLSELINAEARGTLGALQENRHMTTRIVLERIDEETLGALFMFFEAATAFTGYLFDINPFDQPGVELGKKITFGLMGRGGFEGHAQKLRQAETLKIEF